MTEEDMAPNLERERSVNIAWIFDVDGVVTNPQEKRVTEPEILHHIAKKLELGEPVALNTGRSLSWLIERVINPLLERIEDKKVLGNFIAVGEKGGTWLTFGENGKMQQYKDESISVPESLQQEVKSIVETEHARSMFYDISKQTMISVEMKDGYSIEAYKKDQATLKEQLSKLLGQNNLNDQLKIDPTTIAVDVENKQVGKGFATKKILEWLKEQKVKPEQFIAFGDSRSDLEIAEVLHRKFFPCEFVYVGKENIDTSKYSFPIKQPSVRFEQGTLEFLKTL